MNRLLACFLTTLLLAALSGCQSTPAGSYPRIGFYTTRAGAGQTLERSWVKEFRAGELISIVADLPHGCGYGQRSSTIAVRRLPDGPEVFSQKRAMREGRKYEFALPNPGPGEYQLELTYEDSDSPRVTEQFFVR